MARNKRVPSFASEPQIQYLEQLLDEIKRGQLRVPRFQRPFVWKPDQRLELLRSVRDGIPFGTIMVWRTTRLVSTYESLGAYRLDTPDEDGDSVRQYILDGVQRLSTLFSALIAPKRSNRASTVDPEADDLRIVYNLGSRDFELSDGAEAETSMPLDVVLTGVDLLRFQRSLVSPKADKWIERADEIARAFREYKVPIIPIATEELSLATRTFQRINSQGTVMGELHMLNALSWSPAFDLLARIEALKSSHLADYGWKEIDDDVIVKACKAALDYNIYNTDDVDTLSKRIVDVLDEVFVALARAAAFLASECKIRDPELVPYTLQIVLLAEALRGSPPGLRARRRLRSWFWLTTYAELFGSMSGGRLQIVLDRLRADGGQTTITWPGRIPFKRRALPPRFDFRGARGKALALRLAEADPKDADEAPMDGSVLLNSHGIDALVQLLPRSKVSAALYASPGNRILCATGKISDLRTAILSGVVSSEVLVSHMIFPAAWMALQSGDLAEFIQLRANDLDQFEAAFIEPLAEALSA